MTNNKPRRKLYAGEILAIVALVTIFVGYIAYVLAIPSLTNRSLDRHYADALQANVLAERQLAQDLTEELESIGVKAENGYVAFKDNEAGAFYCRIDGKRRAFDLRDIDLEKPFVFDENVEEFVNPA